VYKINQNSALFFRDLSVIRSEVNKSARTVQGACMDLDKNMRSLDSNLTLELEEERDKRVQVIYGVDLLKTCSTT
jgi:hypothetical protein